MKPLHEEEAPVSIEDLVDSVIHRKWLVLAVWAISIAAAALYALTTRPVYHAKTLLVIEKERGAGVIYTNGALIESKNEDYYQTQYKLFTSETLLEKVYQQLRLADHPDFGGGVDALHQAISIQPVPRSRLVYVRAASFDPELAVRIADQLSDNFVTENLNNQLFISKDILSALQGGSGTRQRYETLPNVVNNTLIQSLKGDLSKLESQTAELSQKVTDRHPAMIAARSNIASLRLRITEETERIVASLRAELSGQLRGNNVRVIDRARLPRYPSFPNRRVLLLMGAGGGLVLGIFCALVLKVMDQSIRTQRDVEEKLHLPCLGAIPAGALGSNQRPYAALLGTQTSLSGEAFRNMRTMIEFAGINEQAKTFLVTSTVQEEGKTHCASNLAVAYAQLGESVLLIDGDLRRPKLHRSFRLSNERGLTQFLAAGKKTEELEALIQSTDVENLKILPCGVQPPNPSELLNTPRVGALASWAKTRFDRVIIDATPIFPVSDALLWGRHVRSAVFVVRFGKTRSPLVINAAQKLASSGVKTLGVALNAVKLSSLSQTGYGRYYAQYYKDRQEEPRAKTA